MSSKRYVRVVVPTRRIHLGLTRGAAGTPRNRRDGYTVTGLIPNAVYRDDMKNGYRYG